MTQPRTVSYAALIVAVLALVVSLVGVAGGFAEAAGRKIGKNLVVTKSIKNGAVTGQKVKDGSLTGADLAAGTVTTANLAPGAVPVPTKDKSVGFAGCGTCVANGPNQVTALQLSGYIPSGSAAMLRMPVPLQIVDVNVYASGQTAGHSLDVVLAYKAPGEPTFTTVPLCTVPVGEGGCDAVGQFAVPANYEALFQTVAGPGGASGTSIVIGYTVRVP
jgi:hypothetical protein